MKNTFDQSIYGLLVRSRKQESSSPETFVYSLLIAVAALSMWHAALQPMRVPSIRIAGSVPSEESVRATPRLRA